MAIIKSAQKRIRQTTNKTARNRLLKKKIRLAGLEFKKNLAVGKPTEIANSQAKLNSLLDTATKKKLFHKNKSARRKALINRQAKAKR